MPNYNQTLQTNNSSLEEIIAQLNNMPDVGEGGLDTSDATATSGDILSGKTAYVNGEKVTGNIATVEQAIPTITINRTTGRIAATVMQSTGYVVGGTKSATGQLAFRAATTITPGATDQIAVTANTYVGGDITVKGDVNLVAANIVSGKSIFGVVGTATTGGGGDTSVEDGLVMRTLTTYTNDRVTTIGSYAFYSCKNLTRVSFPKVTNIDSHAFIYCTNLTSVSLPEAISIGNYAFANCTKLTSISLPKVTNMGDAVFAYNTKLTSVSLPKVTSIGSDAFYYCTSLPSVSLPKVTSIDIRAFYYCASLVSIYLGASTLCTLAASIAFSNTGIWSNKGSIFVPASLLASYKKATNWTFFSNRIFSYNF